MPRRSSVATPITTPVRKRTRNRTRVARGGAIPLGALAIGDVRGHNLTAVHKAFLAGQQSVWDFMQRQGYLT